MKTKLAASVIDTVYKVAELSEGARHLAYGAGGAGLGALAGALLAGDKAPLSESLLAGAAAGGALGSGYSLSKDTIDPMVSSAFKNSDINNPLTAGLGGGLLGLTGAGVYNTFSRPATKLPGTSELIDDDILKIFAGADFRKNKQALRDRITSLAPLLTRIPDPKNPKKTILTQDLDMERFNDPTTRRAAIRRYLKDEAKARGLTNISKDELTSLAGKADMVLMDPNVDRVPRAELVKILETLGDDATTKEVNKFLANRNPVTKTTGFMDRLRNRFSPTKENIGGRNLEAVLQNKELRDSLFKNSPLDEIVHSKNTGAALAEIHKKIVDNATKINRKRLLRAGLTVGGLGLIGSILENKLRGY